MLDQGRVDRAEYDLLLHLGNITNLDRERLAFNPKLDHGSFLESDTISMKDRAGARDDYSRIEGSLGEPRRCGHSLDGHVSCRGHGGHVCLNHGRMDYLEICTNGKISVGGNGVQSNM